MKKINESDILADVLASEYNKQELLDLNAYIMNNPLPSNSYCGQHRKMVHDAISRAIDKKMAEEAEKHGEFATQRTSYTMSFKSATRSR